MRSAIIIAAAAASVLAAAGASAGEVLVYEEDYGPDDGYVEAPPPVVRHRPYAEDYLPPVMGWVYAPPPPPPTDCGTYHYWNGDYCADARDEPPPSAYDPD